MLFIWKAGGFQIIRRVNKFYLTNILFFEIGVIKRYFYFLSALQFNESWVKIKRSLPFNWRKKRKVP